MSEPTIPVIPGPCRWASSVGTRTEHRTEVFRGLVTCRVCDHTRDSRGVLVGPLASQIR